MNADFGRRAPTAERTGIGRATPRRSRQRAEPGRRFSPGPLSGYLDFALRQAQIAVFAGSGALLSRFELTPGAFAVLIVIDRNPGLRATDVCQVLSLQKANLAPLLRGLERRGMVVRRSYELDRRTRCLQLTATGARLLARARRAHERAQRALSARLGVAATRRLISQLLEIAEHT
jgi:DNA-binding MarR family transcriptional regulator